MIRVGEGGINIGRRIRGAWGGGGVLVACLGQMRPLTTHAFLDGARGASHLPAMQATFEDKGSGGIGDTHHDLICSHIALHDPRYYKYAFSGFLFGPGGTVRSNG